MGGGGGGHGSARLSLSSCPGFFSRGQQEDRWPRGRLIKNKRKKRCRTGLRGHAERGQRGRERPTCAPRPPAQLPAPGAPGAPGAAEEPQRWFTASLRAPTARRQCAYWYGFVPPAPPPPPKRAGLSSTTCDPTSFFHIFFAKRHCEPLRASGAWDWRPGRVCVWEGKEGHGRGDPSQPSRGYYPSQPSRGYPSQPSPRGWGARNKSRRTEKRPQDQLRAQPGGGRRGRSPWRRRCRRRRRRPGRRWQTRGPARASPRAPGRPQRGRLPDPEDSDVTGAGIKWREREGGEAGRGRESDIKRLNKRCVYVRRNQPHTRTHTKCRVDGGTDPTW